MRLMSVLLGALLDTVVRMCVENPSSCKQSYAKAGGWSNRVLWRKCAPACSWCCFDTGAAECVLQLPAALLTLHADVADSAPQALML